MNTLLQSLKTWAVNWALGVLLAFAWLVLGATLDGPSETDALQASADINASLAAMHAAAKGP